MKRSLVSLLLILSILWCFCLPFSASALTPSYSLSKEYLSGSFAAKLKAVELTGDERTDVILVALSQFGYHEGNSDADFNGNNADGSRNFVEYNRIYGKLDNGEGNGESYGYAWCCAFATWCARQAGIQKTVVPTEVSCMRLIENNFMPMDVYHSKDSGYLPKTADYIFFNHGSSRISNHVGLVLFVNDGKVYTIEGNSIYDSVSIFSYDLNDSTIVGYGAPKYNENADKAIEFNPRKVALNSQNNYLVTASKLNLRAEANSNSAIFKTLNYGDRISISEINGNWAKTEHNGKTGWVSLTYIQYFPILTSTIIYDTMGGSLVGSTPINANGTTTITSDIPTKAGYLFDGWATSKDLATDGQKAFNSGDASTFKEDTTLYAVWKSNKSINITLVDDKTTLSTHSINLGQSFTLPELPTKTSEEPKVFSYTVLGWDINGDGAPDNSAGDVITPTDDIKINAVYNKNYVIYTVSFIGLKGETLSTQQLKYGELPAIPDRVEGYFSDDGTVEYVFDRWNAEIVKVSENATYTAVAKTVTHQTNVTTPSQTTKSPEPTTASPTLSTTFAEPTGDDNITAEITTASEDSDKASTKNKKAIPIVMVSGFVIAVAAGVIIIYTEKKKRNEQQ